MPLLTAKSPLCRIGDDDVPQGVPHVEVRLIDWPGADDNLHLDFVLLEAVRVIERFRQENKTVLLHCVEAQSRTPTVAALHGARRCGVNADQALEAILQVLPNARPNPAFRAALNRLAPATSVR